MTPSNSSRMKVMGLSRASRKKLQTKDRLLISLQNLLLEKDFNDINITDITELADVGLGTFYNYFDSKSSMLASFMEVLAKSYNTDLDQIIAHLEDPAEVLAASALFTLNKTCDGTHWGKLIFDSGIPFEAFALNLKERGLGDIKTGIKAGRFKVNDQKLVFSMIVGSVLSVASELYYGTLSKSVIYKCADNVLLLLGIDEKEAKNISRKSYPKVSKRDIPISLFDFDLEL